MKIKTDFVTNSSSTSFILAIREDQLQDLVCEIQKIDGSLEASGEGAIIYNSFETVQHLNVYTNDGPLDWVSKLTEPKFINKSKYSYDLMKKHIIDGKIVVDLEVDNNVGNEFKDKWYKYIINN